MSHCTDLSGDRGLGKFWERQFCIMAGRHGHTFTPHQFDRASSAQAFTGPQWRTLTLPDVTIWSAPGQHHEIKHKAPTRYGSFGLEKYRLEALVAFSEECRQDVYYTIHCWDKAPGGRDGKQSRAGDWYTLNVERLKRLIESGGCILSDGPSWVNGKKKIVPIYYWPSTEWATLLQLWCPIPSRVLLSGELGTSGKQLALGTAAVNSNGRDGRDSGADAFFQLAGL